MTGTENTMPCALEAAQTSEEEAEAVRDMRVETYRVMADAMPQIVWSATPEGFRDYFNERWYAHTRMTTDQSEGWGWVSALHKEDSDRCKEAWKAAATKRESFVCEYRLYCAEDGSYRWQVERALPVYDPEDEIIKWFGTCTDIHELKQAQAEIESLNVRLQRSMTETHHRVKNNLQIIAAMVDMQLMNAEELVSLEEFKRLGSHIRTLATVHDILTKESKEETPQQAISLKEIMDKLLPVHQQTSPHCHIVSRIEDVRLSGRQGTSLALLVNELVSNAIKHGKNLVEVVVAREDHQVTVSVCDDGAGFPVGFDVRSNSNTGLELVDSLARWDLGGKIEFANQPQGGAQITLWIPLPRLSPPSEQKELG